MITAFIILAVLTFAAILLSEFHNINRGGVHLGVGAICIMMGMFGIMLYGITCLVHLFTGSLP